MLKVLAILPDYIPSTIINVTTPLKYLCQLGEIEFAHCLESMVTPQQVAGSDVIVACRNLEPIYNPVFQLADQLQIPIIYDLDDDLFDVPESDVFSSYYRHPKRRAALGWMLSHATLVRVHSPALKDIVHPYNPRVNLVWAAVDWTLVPETLPEIKKDPVEIVYATSRTKNDNLFQQMYDDLLQTLEKFGEQVRLNILGLDPGDLKSYPQVVYRQLDADYPHFFRDFTRYGYSIGLAPMETDLFHQCKTDTKYRDYAAAGAVGIYTDCPLYRQGVTHMETGLLISGARGSWTEAITLLVEQPELVERIRQKARRFVQERNSMEAVSQMWLRDILAMPKRPVTPESWSPPRWRFTQSSSGHWMRYRRLYRSTVPINWRIQLRDLRIQLRAFFNV